MKTLLIFKFLPLLVIGLLVANTVGGDYSINTVLSENCVITDPVYTVKTIRTDKIKYGNNTMQVNVYATYPSGQVLLRHTAIIGTGDEYNNNGYQTCSDRYDIKSGPEYIIKDEMLNGSIRDFFMSRHDIYNEFVIQKRQITGVE